MNTEYEIQTAPDTPATEAAEDNQIKLFPVLTLPEGKLWLGNRIAADSAETLLNADITSTLNVAINAPTSPLKLSDGTVVRRSKIGLIDGAGNTPAHLLSAALAIHGMLTQASPGKAHYPQHRKGGVLVHCRGGRSRSVTALALYLHLRQIKGFENFDEGVQVLRDIRGMDGKYPLPPTLQLAYDAIDLFKNNNF